MRFEKWQALGNDYVIVEAAALPFELTPERIRRICEPHFGVGSDGVLLLAPVEDPEHVAELRIFNPDGSEAELSGNGAREAVLYLRAAGWTDADEFRPDHQGRAGAPADHRPEHRCDGDRARIGDLRRLPGRAARRNRKRPLGRAGLDVPARERRQPAMRDRRRRGR